METEKKTDRATNVARCAAIVGAILAIVLTAVVYLESMSTNATEPCAPGCCPAVVAPAEDELCGRSHLRKRTNRFFRRSIG